MRRNLLLLSLVFLSSSIVYSQDIFISINDDLKTNTKKPEQSFLVVNKQDNSVAVFIDDNKTVNAYLYDELKRPIGKLTTEGLPNKYNAVIGHTINGKSIRLFLNSSNGKKFGSILFDFESGRTLVTEHDFKLKKEIFLETFSREDHLYAFTVSKVDNSIMVYDFDHNGNTSSSQKFMTSLFKDKMRRPRNLYGALNISAGLKTVPISKIEEGNPASLEMTSKLTKIYVKEDGVSITLDQNRDVTSEIVLNYPDFEPEVKTYQKPDVQTSALIPKTNSYILKDKIYHISSTSERMVFAITDRNTGDQVKTYTVAKDDDISFKNTPIIQEGGMYDSYRTLEKTSKFLRKISASRNGVAVIPSKDSYNITLGGITETQGGGGGPMMMPGFGGVGGGIGGPFAVASFNPTFFAYSSYKHTKSTRIEGMFDIDYNHITGDIDLNVFDRIKEFSDELKPIAENVINYKNKVLYGTYYKKTKKFVLYTFEK